MLDDGMPSKYARRSKSKIGVRLSFYFVLISLVFVLVSTLVMMRFEYQFDQQQMLRDAENALNTVDSQLAKSLWDYDAEAIKTALSGLIVLPILKGAEVEGISGESYTQGVISEQADMNRELIYRDRPIGRLSIFFNTDVLEQIMLSKYQNLLLYIIGVIVLMGSLFYLIVDRSIIRHIAHISKSRDINTFNDNTAYQPLQLPRRNREDELKNLVLALNDGRRQAVELINAKKKYHQQMLYQANYDLLTGLPNRRKLFEHLAHEIESYDPDNGCLAIVFADLDGFKQVNDSMGHEVGDAVLRESALRLQAFSQSIDGFIGRLGGDEFIICFYVSDMTVLTLAAQDAIAVFDDNIEVNDLQIKLGCSIGVTLYPDHDIEQVVDLIRHADKALYVAKQAGRNTFFIFDDLMMKSECYEKSIKEKIKGLNFDKSLKIHYQPLIDIERNKIIGFEAIARWYDKELGWVDPRVFIPAAEKSSHIFEIDIWVLKAAVAQVAEWREKYDEDFTVSVNFSPTNFYHSRFDLWVKNENIFKGDIDWLEMEISERLILREEAAVIEGIKKIKQKGVSFSVDDFGVTCSSFSYIKNLSKLLSKIKIDRMFISEISIQSYDSAFVHSVKKLAEELGLEVVAKGIENESQLEKVKSIACHYAQGYLFEKPLLARDIEALFEKPALDIQCKLKGTSK